jgi:hypothetical protein
MENIILKLEVGERPPREFHHAAEQEIRLGQWTQKQDKADGDESLEEPDRLGLEEDNRSEACRIWARS